VVAADASLEDSSEVFAVRARASDATIFLTGREIIAYLKRLETKEHQIQFIDFSTLQAEVAAAPPEPAKKEKEDAKIEGAVQIAIGVKKEVDFATWYTNVRNHSLFVFSLYS
jgi:prolyl-tRNA synthetase